MTGAMDIAKSTAKDAKAVAEIAKNAASGNVAGTAIAVVKNKDTVMKAIAIILGAIVILSTLLASVPSQIAEGAETFFGSVNETVATTSTGDVVNDTLTYVFRYIGALSEKTSDSLKDFFNSVGAVIGFGREDDSEEDESIKPEDIDERYLAVGYEEAAALEVLDEQADAILVRYKQREKQIRECHSEVVSDFAKAPPAIASGYDEYRVTGTLNCPSVEKINAVQVMCAYATQRNGSLTTVKLRDYLDWVGKFNKLSSEREYVYADGREFSLVKWTGTCMPQYLVEQHLYEEEAIKRAEEKGETPPAIDESYYEAFQESFLMKSLYIDSIDVNYVPSTETRSYTVDGVTYTYTVSILTAEITTNVTWAGIDEISDDVLGLVRGLRSTWKDNPQTPSNKYQHSSEYLAYEWEYNGETYIRLYDCQYEYFRDLQITTAQYMNLASYTSHSNVGVGGGGDILTVARAEYQRSASDPTLRDGGRKYLAACGLGQNHWCCAFVYWCAQQCGYVSAEGCFGPTMSALCQYSWAQFGGNTRYPYSGGAPNKYGTTIVANDTVLFGGDYEPQPGDLIYFYSKNCGGAYVGNDFGHIGIVESYNASTGDLWTIEGNTGPARNWAENGAGNIVNRKNRTNGSPYGRGFNKYAIIGFVHPNYPDSVRKGSSALSAYTGDFLKDYPMCTDANCSVMRQHESGNSIATISSGAGDAGGKSYGINQYASKSGGLQVFMNTLSQYFPEIYDYLDDAPLASEAYDAAWRKLCREKPDEFYQAQIACSYLMYFEPFNQRAKKEFGIDFSRSHALVEMGWYLANGHGPEGAIKRCKSANINSSMTDAEIVDKTYTYIINNISSIYSGCSSSWWPGLKTAYTNIREEILAMC